MSEVEQILLPNGFKRIEYLQSDRYQYIKIDLFDDGDKQLNNKGVWITWQPTTRYKYQNIFTCFNSDGSVFMTPHWNGDSNAILCGFVNRTNGAYRKNNYSLEFDKRYDSKLNYLNDGKAFINDTLIADINKNLTYTSDKFIVHLFGCNEDGNHSVVNSSYCKINRARITSGETITHDLIACLDADGRPCMYDLITNKPFYNDGIGEFSYNYSLPKGFKKIEYLQANDSQWIDTGYVPSNNTGMYVRAQQNVHSNSHVMGSGIDTNSPADGFTAPRLLKSTGNTCGFGWGGWTSWGNFGTGDVFDSQLNYLNDRKAILRIDKNGGNTYSSDLGELPFTPVKTIYMFTTNKGNTPNLIWNGKIFEAKITEGIEVVKHFIPCLNDDNVPCMYDLISQETFYNQGDGQFNYPRDYPSSNYNLPAGFKKCVYLQSDGTQWIDTGVVPDNETGLYFKGIQLTYGNFVPFGVGEGSNAIYPPRFSDKDLYYRWGGTGVKMMTWDKAGDLIFHSSLNFYDSKIAKFDSEDTDVESFITSQTGTYTLSIRLFSYNLNGSYSATYGKWTGRVYRAQITQGTNLIHDYVPCLDTDNRPCMYDLIDQEALYNQSGGTEFTYCVEHQLPSNFIKLKYLESDSNLQHIKTGYVPTNNTGMYVDAYNIVVEDRVVMGMQNTTGNDRMWIGGVMKSTYGARYGWGTATTPGGTGDVRFEASLNWLNDKKSIITCPAFAQRVNTLSDLTFTPNQDIYIFGWNRQGSLAHWKGRIYRAKISEGTEIVRDFVPAFDQRNSKPCMYDLINNVAYYNDGEGEFLSNRDYEGDYIGCGVLGGIGNRLGVSSIDGIPMDYIRIKFLESTGTQWMNTNYVPTTYTGVYIKYQGTENSLAKSSAWPIMSYDDVNHAIAPLTNRYQTSGSWYWQNKIDPGYWGKSPDYIWESTINFYDNGNTSMKVIKNGDLDRTYVLENSGNPRRFDYTPTDPFRICYVKWNNAGVCPWIIYNVKITEGLDLKRNYVPVIDPTGVPCMYDTVTGTPLYNSGSDNFVAGLKNLYSALYLKLSKQGGTITLSLPTNDNVEFYENKIRANNPNWTITFQYH